MPMKPLLPASLLATIALAACQSAPSAPPSDVEGLIARAVSEARAEVCRGQAPAPLGVSPEEFDTWPEAARRHVIGNYDQWQEGCGTS